MYGDDEQTKISEHLTIFLRSFKSILGSKLKIVQSIINGTQQHNEIIIKTSSQNSIRTQQYLNNNSIISGLNLKIFCRFFLRMNQFLQYRLSQLKTIKDSIFKPEVLSFEKALLDIYIQASKQLSLSTYLKKILIAESKFIDQLIIKITKNSSKLMINFENIKQISKIIKQKFPTINFAAKVKTPNLNSKFLEGNSILSRSQLNNSHLGYYICRKNSKKQQKVTRFSNRETQERDKNDILSLGYVSVLPSIDSFAVKKLPKKIKVKNVSGIKYLQFQKNQIITKLENFENQQHNYKISNILSQLMQLEHIPNNSSEQLMNRLQELNKKNFIQIIKFRKKYLKKHNSQQNLGLSYNRIINKQVSQLTSKRFPSISSKKIVESSYTKLD